MSPDTPETLTTDETAPAPEPVTINPADHLTAEDLATAEAPASTQVSYPGQAGRRTALQTIISTALSIASVALIVLQIVQDELSQLTVPEGATALGATVLVATALSAILARVMAIPQVDAWLQRVGLGSKPRGEE